MNESIKNGLIAVAWSNASVQQELNGAVIYSALKNSIDEFKNEFQAEHDAALFRVANHFSITIKE